MESKPINRVLKYRDLARNVRASLESLLPGEIVEVRGERKGVICYLTKELETITSRGGNREKQNDDSWF